MTKSVIIQVICQITPAIRQFHKRDIATTNLTEKGTNTNWYIDLAPHPLDKDYVRRMEQQKMRWGLDSITDSTDKEVSNLQETVKDIGAWRAAVHRVAESDKT